MRRLWLDSSVARKPRTLSELVELAKQHDVALLVHPQVHLEMCRHLCCTKGPEYSESMITSLLAQTGITIEPMSFDRHLAERWAKRLHERYPSTQHWEKAKLSTIGGDLASGFAHEPGRMPMTTDWWVALQVEEADEDRVAVDDQGGEWTALRDMGRAMRPDKAREWIVAPAGT